VCMSSYSHIMTSTCCDGVFEGTIHPGKLVYKQHTSSNTNLNLVMLYPHKIQCRIVWSWAAWCLVA